jgi:glutamate--cysteine ligase
LTRENSLGGGSITLEPAGQFELSGAMLDTVHETFIELLEHKKQISKIGEKMGLDFLAIGFTPDWSRDEMPIMPKKRYDIMRSYMPTKGDHGLDMMLRSCTSQVNLDYSSEIDMIKKLRLSFLLQPISTALFSNSPFCENSLNGFSSYRSEVWKDTDPDRTGILTFIFDDDMGYERYVDYAMKVPMYFINRNGDYINLTGYSFDDFMNGKIESVKDFYPTIDDWELHLTTIFPEARLKKFIEMRGADAGSIEHVCALSAFWVGLMYDNNSLNAALELTKDISPEDLVSLRNIVPKKGLHSKLNTIDMYQLASEILSISKEGLIRRNNLDENNLDESHYLRYLEDVISHKESPADNLAKKFKNSWNEEISKIYENCRF